MAENLLYILGSRNRGGVEKRFINYFLFICSQKELYYNYILVINRSVIREDEKEILDQDKRIKKYYYGRENHCYHSKSDKKIHLILLFLTLCWIRISTRVNIVHFITTSSLNFTFLFKRVDFKVTSLYSTGHIEEILNLTVIRKTIKYLFHYDCLSEKTQTQCMKYLGIKEEQAHLAPGSFINLRNTEFDMKEKENIITWDGTLNEQKGTLLLLEFLPYLKDSFVEFKLIILGQGFLKNKLIEKIEKFALKDQVMITYTEIPKDYFRKSKVFFSFQENDNYPSQSLLEAMACGNAIIATDVGETSKLVNYENGILIKRDALNVRNALKEILSKDLEKLGMNARKIVLEKHTVDNYHEYLMDIYERKNDNLSENKEKPKPEKIRLFLWISLIYYLGLILLYVVPLDGKLNLNQYSAQGFRMDHIIHALIFIPTPFIMAPIFQKHTYYRILKIIFISLLIATIFETIHIPLSYRAFTLEDLMSNIFGVLIGSILYVIFQRTAS
ncbi:MAG: glycosyltransferase [Brumimicrobium sp.]|nr:glycosyltransferase [Brumimicrobium sp.]